MGAFTMALAAIAAAPCAAERPLGVSGPEAIRRPTTSYELAYEAEIVVPFEVSGYRLIKGYRVPAPLPVEASTQLYAVGNDERHPVSTEQDLRGLVRIEDAVQALAFCRLLTSGTTRWCIRFSGDRHITEIHIPNQVDAVYACQDGSRVACREAVAFRLVHMDPERSFDVASTELSDSLQLRPAFVRRHKERFIVERNILTYAPDSVHKRLYRSRETVHPDGSYTHEVARLISDDQDTLLGLMVPFLL